MAYRDAARSPVEVVESFGVSTKKGAALTGILLAVALIFGVLFGVTVAAGAPPEIEKIAWTFPVGMLLFAVPTVWLWQTRKRTLQIVRVGDKVQLVVPGFSELTFPLALSGNTAVMRMNGIPIHHVYLKLVDGEGRGLLIEEVRGAIHGGLPEWFDAIDRTTRADAYEVRRIGDAARLRSRVEELNAAALVG
jgi:hypothetical protein